LPTRSIACATGGRVAVSAAFARLYFLRALLP
jgi:hypothetical protein